MPTVARTFLAALVVLLTGLPAAGQTPLTLDQAIGRALDRSPAIRRARAGVARADAERSIARAARLPTVTFSEAARRSDEPVFVFSSLLSSRRFTDADFAVDVLNHPGARNFYRRSVGLQQVFYDGGRTSSAIRSARLQRDVADLSLRQAAADLVVSVTEEYGRVLAAESRARAAEAAASAATEDLARAERQRDAGRATDADVLALSAHLAEVRQRAIQAAGDAAVARARVNQLMGAPVASAFDAAEPPLDALETGDLPALFARAESARPDVARALAGGRLAEAAAAAARAGWLPRVLGQAEVESDGLTFDSRSSGWVAGVELQWSVSIGGGDVARGRAAAAAVSEARAAIDEARAVADADVLAARTRQQSARARLEVGRAAVAQARESERIVRDRFDVGLVPVGELLRASALVLEAQSGRIDALVDALLADAQLDRAVGRDPFLNR